MTLYACPLLTYGSIKAVKYYRDLKKANSILTLEKCLKSSKNSQIILKESSKRWTQRESVFKNGKLKIQMDKRGKHIIGHKNYNVKFKKSIFEHKNPQKLVDNYAGTGRKMGKRIPGTPGFKEIVDFEESIGYYINPKTGEKVSTTWGAIHYAKDGTHIVPELPRK